MNLIHGVNRKRFLSQIQVDALWGSAPGLLVGNVFV